MDIDFVVLWVDGNDPKWLEKRAKFKGEAFQLGSARYRDWDLMRYWFRAVEKYAPWVHKIYFVTDNQCPNWLRRDHPKLVMVDHRDFIPEKFLPTFNTNCIELNLHRISGLSEYFVAFNDDIFLTQPIEPENYFSQEGLPCDAPYEMAFYVPEHSDINHFGVEMYVFRAMCVIRKHFKRNKVIKGNLYKWHGPYMGLKYFFKSPMLLRQHFVVFGTTHNEKSFLKSVYEEVWQKEVGLLNESCTHFREDTNLSNYFIRYWQLASNKFAPFNVRKNRVAINIGKDCIPGIKTLLNDKQIKSLCLNDGPTCSDADYEALKPQIISLFEKKLPEKCSFEID